MKKVERVSELPEWAQLKDRYKHYKEAPLLLIYEELKARAVLLYMIGKSDYKEFTEEKSINNFFCSKKAFIPVEKRNLHSLTIPLDDRSCLDPLCKGDLIPFTRVSREDMNIDFAKPLHMVEEITSITNYNLFLGIDLKVASDAEIIDELRNRLKQFRQEAGIPEPRWNSQHNKQLQDIVTYGVFEELDLQIWEKLTKKTIDSKTRVNVIRNGIFTEKELKQKTIKAAERSIHPDYLNRLNIKLCSTRISMASS